MVFVKTLECLCIQVVAKEFDRYLSAFNAENGYFKKKFEFLLRVYSSKVASEIVWLHDLEAIHIEVLVNKYIKVLHSYWFRNVSWETVTVKLAEVGSNIQKIVIYDSVEEKPWQTIIHNLINIEVVIFDDYDCDDEILKCIAQFCPKILEIDVTDSRVTNEGIKYLCMKENGKPVCPNLKKLLIADTNVNDEGIKYLIENLRSLEETDYRYLPRVIVSSQRENYFSGLDNVEPFNLTSLNLLSRYPDISFNFSNEICLTLCPRLKSLSCLIRREEHLNLFPYELEELKLVCFLDYEINITFFLKLKGRMLTSLSLSFCSLSVSSLAESCPCLEKLYLHMIRFKNDDVSPVFENLDFCCFEDTMYESATIKSISLLLTSSPNLMTIGFERIDLFSSDMKDVILRCCKYRTIYEVIFIDSTVGMDFIKDIFMKSPLLKWFKIKNCDVSREDVVEFYGSVRTLLNNRNIYIY